MIHIVTVANCFDHVLCYEKLSPKDALKKVLIEKVGELSLDTMKALQATLKNHEII